MRKVHFLKWYNILILTLILFGEAIYTSNNLFFTGRKDGLSSASSINFSTSDNYKAFLTQFILLGIALLYLKYIKFDFSVWKISISKKGILYGVLLFIFVSGIMDIYFSFIDSLFPQALESIPVVAEDMNTSTIIYAMLNGVYEEIFFLGICLAVEDKYKLWAFLYSLIIRFSFHTYQGVESAIGIGILMGSLYFIFYQKSRTKNLFPYFFSHMIADVLGLSILRFF